MNTEPGHDSSPIRRNLRLSTRDGSWYCVMWSLGESNIQAFGTALGLSAPVVGLLDTVPRVCGSLLQLVSPRAVVKLGSLRRWIVTTAVVQALVFLPLALAALIGGIAAPFIFILAAIYWGAAWACANTWTTFISIVVPRRVRASFFSLRNRWLNLVIVAATLVGGWILAGAKSADGHRGELLAFAALFMVACFSRLLSALYLHRHTERVSIPPGNREVPLRELIGRYRHGAGGRLLSYRIGVEFAIQTSTPFIVPFFLTERGLSNNYTLFGVLVASQILAKAAVLPLWGRIAHIHGPRALLRIGGFALVPLPLLWLVDSSIGYMILVQVVSGMLLGAYELASFLLVFDTVPEHERTSVMSRFNVAQFTATLIGSLIGGALLGLSSGFALVFIASALFRLLTLILLARIPQQVGTGNIPDSVGDELPPLASSLEQAVIPIHDQRSDRSST